MARPKKNLAPSKPAGSGTKPTLKTIAALSGLAVPTVSRALSDAPDIGLATKIRVRKIAAEIGYVPNRAGVRLRTGRTNVISLVMSTEHDMMNHTARLISSVAGGLRDTPYHLIVTPYFPNEDPMIPVRYIVESGSADAVILNQIEPNDKRVAYLMERKFPFATHGRSKWAEKHPYYDFDNGAFGDIAVRELAARGRKNIYIVAPPVQHNYAINLIDSIHLAGRDIGVAIEIAQNVTSDSTSNDIVDAVSAHLTQNPAVDAIIAASTSSAMAAVAALEQCGKQVGREIDVYTKEAIPFFRLFRANILTMTEDVGTAGVFLARAAIQAIRHPEKAPLQELEVPTRQSD